MITQATITSVNVLPPRLRPQEPARGQPDYRMTGRDLMAFARSPKRWELSSPPVDPPKAGIAELARAMFLVQPPGVHGFVRRPDSISAMRMACPKCRSRSPAKVCRSCGVARRNEVQTVNFSATVRECAEWAEAQEKAGRVVVGGSLWDNALEVSAGLMADAAIAQMAQNAEHLALLQGTWLDEATGLSIPVEALVDLAPRTGTACDNCLCTVDVTPDATPGAWAFRAQGRGLHVRAALAHELFARATGDPREKHLWALVEVGGGHMAGHRRASAEMLDTGRDALATLLGAYAQCLSAGTWPAFDPPEAPAPDAWTEVHLEPWMVDPQNGSCGYFAVGATEALRGQPAAGTEAMRHAA